MPRRFMLASQARITYSGRPSTSCFPSGVFTWPNLVATTTPSRRPRSALPSSVSLCPQPYMSAESRKLMPWSSAWWMTPIDSSSFALPYTPDMDIRPRPTAETLMPLRPSARRCMRILLQQNTSCPAHCAAHLARLALRFQADPVRGFLGLVVGARLQVRPGQRDQLVGPRGVGRRAGRLGQHGGAAVRRSLREDRRQIGAHEPPGEIAVPAVMAAARDVVD